MSKFKEYLETTKLKSSEKEKQFINLETKEILSLGKLKSFISKRYKEEKNKIEKQSKGIRVFNKVQEKTESSIQILNNELKEIDNFSGPNSSLQSTLEDLKFLKVNKFYSFNIDVIDYYLDSKGKKKSSSPRYSINLIKFSLKDN